VPAMPQAPLSPPPPPRMATNVSKPSSMGLTPTCVCSAVHRFKDEITLAREFYSIGLLLEAPEIQRFGKYAASQRVPLKWGLRQ
jgi:hypothetical protein